MFYYRQRILSSGQLRSLGEHKYSSVSSSLLDPLLQPWWNYLVSKTPGWLAPNVITLGGLAVNVATSLVLVWYSPDARADPPRWACLLCALGLFVYQSLDAIDGKQARITNTSSPLGELFDHGCDAVSTVFLVLSATLTVRLGHYPHLMYLLCFVGMSAFYCAHWKTYVTGTLRFGRFDATEAQTAILATHVISATCGADVWWTRLPYLDAPVILVVGVATLLLAGLFVAASLVEICAGGVGKNGSSVAGTSVLSPAIPFGLALVPGYVIYWKSVEGVYENNPALYVLAFGMVCAKVTTRLVVAHMSRTEIDYLDAALVGPAMLFFNQYFDTFLPERAVLCACLAWIVVDLVDYTTRVCREICDHLDIRLFSIPAAAAAATPSRVGDAATAVSTPRRGLFGVTWSPGTNMARGGATAGGEGPEAGDTADRILLDTADRILLDTSKGPISLDRL